MRAIAIDGPVAAGKTSTAALVGRMLNIPHIKTGELFRALALSIINRTFTDSPEQLAQLLDAGKIQPEFVINGQEQIGVILCHHDPFADPVFGSDELQSNPRLDQLSSDLSKNPAIREALLEAETRAAHKGPCVMEGRDIGTVVLPDADVKIYLTADLDTRTDRRIAQRGLDPAKDFWPTLKSIRERDSQDMNRKVAPLRIAEDALRLDNTRLTLRETASIITALARARGICDVLKGEAD